MLYATTRSKLDTYTFPWAMREDTAPDGGLYVPVQLPKFSPEEIRGLKDCSAGDAVAQVLNRFFTSRVSGRDVEFLIGRNFYRTTQISHRITVAEIWRNPEGSFDRIVRELSQRVAQEQGSGRPSEWTGIVARIAMLFALFGELERDGSAGLVRPVDVAVPTGDFSAPMAAWYARRMGLPIGTIICCCNENSGVWDLLRRGQMRTGVHTVHTITPACDVSVPQGLDRLISAALGEEEAVEFDRIRTRGGVYELNPEQHRRLREGMNSSVVGSSRLSAVIPNVYRTHGCVLDPYGALSYAGLMDYRAMSGESRPALLLCEQSPILSRDVVAGALGMDETQLRGALGLA